jgi:hypothetical protein
VVGSGTAASIDGFGAAAAFNAPQSITLDVAATVTKGGAYLYVVEAGATGNRVRGVIVIADGGINNVVRVVTCSSSGAAAAALLTSTPSPTLSPGATPTTTPTSPTPTPTPTPSFGATACTLTTFAGSGATGYLDSNNPLTAQFNQPYGLALSLATGTMYVAENGNLRVRAIAANGSVATLAGGGVTGFANGLGTRARFSYLYGITLTPDGTSGLYVCDVTNHALRYVSLPSGGCPRWLGQGVCLDTRMARARWPCSTP